MIGKRAVLAMSCLVAALAVVAPPPAAAGPGAMVVRFDSRAGYVYPLLTGEPESVDRTVYLDRPANVTIDVTDSLGRRVRRLVDDVSAPEGRLFGAWNLRDDAGALVPDGEYTMTATAVDQFTSASTTRVSGVSRIARPVLSEPAPDTVVSGPTTFGFTVPPALGSEVDVELVGASRQDGIGCTPAPRQTVAGGQAVTAVLDAATCSRGPTVVRAHLEWVDPLGTGHSGGVTTDASVQVADLLAPTTSINGSEHVREQHLETAVAYAPLRLTVLSYDVSGHVRPSFSVRTSGGALVVAERPVVGYSTDRSTSTEVIWDGVDDAGRRVAGGSYVVSVETPDTAGNVSVVTQRVTMDDRVPATLAFEPVAGAPDTYTAIVTPLPGVAISSVYLDGPPGSLTRDTATGTFRGTTDLSRAGPGPHRLSAVVDWAPNGFDGAGARFTTAPIALTGSDREPRSSRRRDRSCCPWRPRRGTATRTRRTP